MSLFAGSDRHFRVVVESEDGSSDSALRLCVQQGESNIICDLGITNMAALGFRDEEPSRPEVGEKSSLTMPIALADNLDGATDDFVYFKDSPVVRNCLSATQGRS